MDAQSPAVTVVAGPEATSADARSAEHAPATVGRRLAAGLVDGLLLVGGLVVVLALGATTGGWVDWGLALWTLGFVPLYFTLYHGFGNGATPGQLELRIAVADARRSGTPGVRRALGRSLLGLLFAVLVLPILADLLTLAVSGRSLRDRITGTDVVHLRLRGALPELRLPTVAGLVDIFEPPAGTRRHVRRGWALVRARPRALVGTAASVFGLLLGVGVVIAVPAVADAPGDVYMWAFLAELVLTLLISGVYWAQAALVLAVEQVRTGAGTREAGPSLRRASRRLNALSAALVLLLAAGTVAVYFSWLIIPLLLACRLTLVVPALVLEDRRVLGSFRRSWQLTRGESWRVFGFVLLSAALLVTLAIAQALAIALVAAVTPDSPSAVGIALFLTLVATLLIVPFVVVIGWLGASWALLYEDARRRLPPREER